MIKRRLPVNRLFLLIASLVALGLFAGWLLAAKRYASFILVAFVILFVVYRLVGIYRSFIRNLDFIFNAVRNNDFSFRFVDRPGRVDNAVLNYSLNRIKEVLDEAKTKTANNEKYFETIIECANIGIIIVLENGSVVKANNRALSLLGVDMLSHIERLRPMSAELADAMMKIGPDEHCNVRFTNEAGRVSLLLNCSKADHAGRSMRVITIENINRELDTQERVAWEKLTRILTHEIMNSLAPVTSISSTLLHANCNQEKMRQGLEVIHSTSDRLMRFVDSYRSVTRIAPPKKTPFYLHELINEVIPLVESKNAAIAIDINPKDTMLYADRGQMSQVFVNLLKNASEACSQRGGRQNIAVNSRIDADEKIHIEVSNSGGAIQSEVAENIFTPFFTTKRDGSGIGLAVSKQIVRLHGGSLYLAHNGDDKVVFAIVME